MRLDSYETLGYTLSGLTLDELRTIADALGGVATPPTLTSRQYYLASEITQLLKEMNG